MRISVLMPVYNRENYVALSIKTILKQTYKDLQLIVYNDGSTDKSMKVVTEIAKKDDRIKIIDCKVNNGIVFARNALLDAVETKWAAWMDSDDLSNIHRLEQQLKYALLGYDIVFANWYHFMGEKSPDFKVEMKEADPNTFAYPTIFFNREKAPRFEEKLRGSCPTTISGEDVDWYTRYKATGVEHVQTSEILYYYRRHNGRVTTWKNNPSLNREWHKRMTARIQKK